MVHARRAAIDPDRVVLFRSSALSILMTYLCYRDDIETLESDEQETTTASCKA
jgi:hypothetical protein